MDTYLAAGEVHAAVRPEGEAVQLAGPAGVVVIVVGDEQEAVVCRDQHAVGPFEFTADDPGDLAVGVDAVDPLDGLSLLVEHLHALALAVLRIREVDAAARI